MPHPACAHRIEKASFDRKAGGRTDHRVETAPGAKSGDSFVIHNICPFGDGVSPEHFQAVEAATVVTSGKQVPMVNRMGVCAHNVELHCPCWWELRARSKYGWFHASPLPPLPWRRVSNPRSSTSPLPQSQTPSKSESARRPSLVLSTIPPHRYLRQHVIGRVQDCALAR